MKAKFYVHPYVTGILSVMLIAQKTNAQCPCASGGGQVVQTIVLDPITALTTPVDFAKFDPSIGDLTCFKLSSTVTTIAGFHLYNNEPFTSNFLFESYRRSQFSGPGGFFVSNTSPATDYGTYSLAAKDLVGTADEVEIGPLTIFNNLHRESYHYSVGDYMGTGNVTFNYLNTYTNTMLTGSSNHTLDVAGSTRLELELIYYWCPSSPLASKNKKPSTGPSSRDEAKVQSVTAYPNPATGGKFSLQFNKPATGNYVTSLVNITGQTVFSQNLQLNNSRSASVSMGSNPPPGLYYLRATDQRTGVTYTNKLFVK